MLADLNNVQGLTNLSFKEFLSAEKVRLAIDINYPLRWNDLQTWNVNVDLTRSSVYFVFYHKIFFQDLINDWSSRFMADIRHFVPYIYDIKLKANQLEFILPCNQHNWIDVNILENNCKLCLIFWKFNCQCLNENLYYLAFFSVLANHVGLNIAFVFDDFLQEKMNIPMDLKVSYIY